MRFLPFLMSADGNLSVTKIEVQVFLKGVQRRAGDGGTGKKMPDSPLNQAHFQVAL